MVRVVGLGLIQNEHGVWCVRRKVPKHLEEAVAVVQGASKTRQPWLKRSLRTKDEARAKVLAKPAMMEFDRNYEQYASATGRPASYVRVPFSPVCPLANRAGGVTSKTDFKGWRRRPGSVASVRSPSDLRTDGNLHEPKAGHDLWVQRVPFGLPPTVLARSGGAISKSELKGSGRRRGSQGRVFATGNGAAHRLHSGNPAFRRPSINSFEFE
jgi:hypothetical protein